MSELNSKLEYKSLIQDIGEILEKGRKEAYKTVNNILVKTYWEIGKRIVKFEQDGNITAKYWSKILINLSKELSPIGKGFSRSNLTYMRLFFIKYSKSETLSHQLSWSHYFELLKIDDDLARKFYEKQSTKENWSVRELKRKKKTMLFERIALSKDKKWVLEMAEEWQIIETAKDIIKEPYILEFLWIPENHKYSEKDIYAEFFISKPFFKW